VSDLHVNSTVGLAPPVFRLDDGATMHHSEFQAKMWACWIDYWQQVGRERSGSEVWAVLNGDIVDGDHHKTPQIFTRNLTDQHRMAVAALAPMMEVVTKIFVIRGTPAHVGAAGQAEELIANEIGAEVTPIGNQSWYRLICDIEGVGFDFAHHGSLGRLPWTKGNIAKRLAIEIELESYRRHRQPPSFVVRGHRHQFADSGMDAPVRVLFLPCWQGPTDYVHGIAPGAQPQIGGLIFQAIDGQATFRVAGYSEDIEWVN